MKTCAVAFLAAGLCGLGGSALAEERLFLDVITNTACLGMSHAIVAAQASYGSILHVFDGVMDKYTEDHRYLLAGKAPQLFIDQAPAVPDSTAFSQKLVGKCMGPTRYRISRVTGYENSAAGIQNSLNRAPTEWYFYGLCRGQTKGQDTAAKWENYAKDYTNGVRSILLDHQKGVVWPKNTCNPKMGSTTYPYLENCNWKEFAIDEKFASYDFVGYRLYCVDSAAKQSGADITFGLGQFEVYVDYVDEGGSFVEIATDGAKGVAGFSPALGERPAAGTTCSAPESYVDEDGVTWYLNGWTLQSRIVGWRDTHRGFTPTYTIPEDDGFIHRLVWHYETRSMRKASLLVSAGDTLPFGLSKVRTYVGDFNGTLLRIFDGVTSGVRKNASGEWDTLDSRALGYIYKGCSATITFSGAELAKHRLVPCGYRILETDFDNNNESGPGRSPTAWNLYGIRENGKRVLLASETGRQSISPLYNVSQKPHLQPWGLTGTVYPITASEAECREGFVGFTYLPTSSIWNSQDPTGTQGRIDFSLNEVEIFVETNGLSEVTVASDIAGTGFSPELGMVVTEKGTLTPPAEIVKNGIAYQPNGYRRYTLEGGAWALAETSQENAYAYDPSDEAVSRLVWQWRVKDETEDVSLWRHAKESPDAAVTVVQGGKHYSGYGAYRAFDGDISGGDTNRWLSNLYCGDTALNIAVTGLEGERLVPQSYTLYRTQASFANDTQRAPSAWVLYGVPAGCESETNRWVELDRRSDVYWSDNSWANGESNPLRAITRTYAITAGADALAAGFASYRFVPLRTYLYDMGTGYDQTLDGTDDINFALAELELNVTPRGRGALVVTSSVDVGPDMAGFLPPVGAAFSAAYEGTRTLTAPATFEADGTRYAAAGYAIEKLDEQTGVWTEESAGDGTSCAYAWQSDGAVRRLVWKWNVTGVRVNADPENGTESVTYSSGDALTYRALGESVTLTANGNAANPASTFECWTGDVDGLADVSNATITVTADRAKRIRPKFLRNWHAWWSQSDGTTYITDGNWTFYADVVKGTTTYILRGCKKGSGDLDFRGKILVANTGAERTIAEIATTFTQVPVTSFTAPESLQRLSANFFQCYSLTNVVFDSPALTNFAWRPFARCKGIRRVTFGPKTRSDLTFESEPFLCEYPNQHPDEFIFQGPALSESALAEFVLANTGILVEKSLVFRVDSTKPGWRALAAKRKPTDWEKYYTPEADRKNFRGVFSTRWVNVDRLAKIIYLPRPKTGLVLLVK